MSQVDELQARVEALQLRLDAQTSGTELYAASPKLPPQPETVARRRGGSILFRRRQQLKPLLCIAGLEAAGGLAHAGGLGVAATVAGLGVGTAWWYGRGQDRIDRTVERRYTLGCWLAASGWLGAAGATGATSHDTLLWTFAPVLAVPWWLHHRLRPRRHQPVSEPLAADWKDEVRTAWNTRIAHSGGPLLGSILLELEEINGGWRAVIELYDGSSDTAISQMRLIGAKLKLRADEISIEPSPRGLHQAIILVQPDNPLAETRYWTRPTLNLDTGVSVIATYADGQAVTYRHWRHGAGPIHTLIAGTTGSGKSELVKLLLAEERHSGVVVSYLFDPQRGQSYSGWKKTVPHFAGNIPDIRKKLHELRRRMYGRNGYLSTIEWRDEKQRLREGIEDFTPLDPRHGLPMLSVTIDEAQTVLADPVCCALVVEMIGMSRKCGIKFRLITPVPLQGSLGESQEIKDAVAGGNVIVLRTANPLSGSAAFNGYMAFDPCELPREWPDGSSTAGLGYVFGPGADRPTTMRSLILDDSYHWATTGTPAIEDDVIEPEPEEDDDQDGQTSEGVRLKVVKNSGPDEDLLAADHVLGWFGAQDDREVEASEVIEYFALYYDMAERTVRKAFKDLTDTQQLERVRRGCYVITRAGRDELRRRTA